MPFYNCWDIGSLAILVERYSTGKIFDLEKKL